MAKRSHVVVIGAGHNGLSAALTLAAKGRQVTVLEANDSLGGLCGRQEFAHGYRSNGIFPDTSGFRHDLVKAYGLEAHGLSYREVEPQVLVSAGDEWCRVPSVASTKAPVDGASDDDRVAYAEWCRFVDMLRPVVRRLLDNEPPRLEPSGAADLQQAASTSWQLRKLGKAKMTEVLRVLPMAAADWMREWFDSESLACGLTAPSLIGSFNGPWAAGSAAAVLFRECVAERSIAGGPTALIDALLKACHAANVEVRSDSRVERIETDGVRVSGVHLAAGEAVEASTVIATCNPRHTLLDLVGSRYLDAATERDLRNYRCRGTLAVLHLAVEGPVDVAGHEGASIERLRLGAGGFDDLERAFDAIKYGRISTQPYLEAWIPTLENPELAPQNCHVISALVSCTPHDLAGGWSIAEREGIIQAAVGRIDRHIPGVRDRLAGGRLLAPPDLEEQFGLTGGHVLHGEPALDQQLFLRPTLHLSHYSTPIGGLFLGGSGSHPGGGVTGMPGRLGAQAALAS